MYKIEPECVVLIYSVLRLIYSFCLAEMEIKVVICFNKSRKMYSCCTAEKWQSAVNETVTYNKMEYLYQTENQE